jgi:signal transduction histidine kinase
LILSDNVATLIHDLKTPIIAQERILDLLLKNTFGELTTSQAEIISQIKNSCKYLENIVYSAMDYYRFNNTNQIKVKKEIFNFKTLLTEIIDDVKPLAKENNQTFNITCQSDKILADKFQIRRVVINFISNAIKYADKNSEIKIDAQQKNNNFVFSIKNNTKKIENINRIFNKFESTTNSGLGLYFVKQIITLHNGSVFAEMEKENMCNLGFVIPNI